MSQTQTQIPVTVLTGYLGAGKTARSASTTI
jgi:hypothetical protein